MKPMLLCLLICFYIISNISSQEDVLTDKVRQLTDLTLKKSVIRLTTERFNHYVKTPPRNYSIIIMLTAMSPQRQCGICKQAHDEYQLVAESYRYSNAFSNKLFFGMVDFDEGAEVFQYLKLNSAPVFIYFPAKGKPKKSDYMDINRRGLSAEQIAKWVQDRSEILIQIYRPPNYSVVLLGGSLVVMMASFLYFKRNSLGFLYNTILWGFFVLFCILTCISGQIWNTIRGPPFVHRNPQTGESTVVCYFISGQTWNLINGPPFMPTNKHGAGIFADDSNMQYVAETYIGLFSGSSGFQFVAETYIVFSIYFGVSVGVILLNEAPKLRSRTGKRQGMVALLGIVIVVFLFSYILSIFRAKYQGYPYSFLIK